MHAVIDASLDIGVHAGPLAAAGVATVVRYYNHQNYPKLPTKCLTAGELSALHGAGLSVAVVFQERGGAPTKAHPHGNIADLTAATGARDGARALHLAQNLGQPQGSAIYFAVDHDFTAAADLASIQNYFAAAQKALGGAYLTGLYGSGLIAKRLKAAGLIEHIWLGALGWSGTKAQLASGNWSLFQKYHNLTSPIGGFGYDGNIVNPAFPNFGQFGPTAAGIAVVDTAPNLIAKPQFETLARSGLKLRAGPGESFNDLVKLPPGTLVDALSQTGDWVQVDLAGDGIADGYMHRAFLQAVAGGLPLALTPGATRPIDVAYAEMALSVAGIPGTRHHPRIIMYHATTSGRFRDDETAWCSSFVNYCVEQSGMRGTDSAAARSWHDMGWGRDVTAAPRKGDIVVFSRTGGNARPGSGHVGFYLDNDPGFIRILGGNQGGTISEDSFPVNGRKGSFTYKLLSIRRG